MMIKNMYCLAYAICITVSQGCIAQKDNTPSIDYRQFYTDNKTAFQSVADSIVAGTARKSHDIYYEVPSSLKAVVIGIRMEDGVVLFHCDTHYAGDSYAYIIHAKYQTNIDALLRSKHIYNKQILDDSWLLIHAN